MSILDIFNKYKSDKGSIGLKGDKGHRYDRFYTPFFDKIKNERLNILEVGVYKGSSLLSMAEYLPNANIYGIDIFVHAKKEEVAALDHNRIKGFRHDSKESLPIGLCDLKFDLIIDDGNHSHMSQRLTFDNLFSSLRNNGKYVIEDVWAFHSLGKQRKRALSKKSGVSGGLYNDLLSSVLLHRNRFHDLRAGANENSFIIEIDAD